MASPIPLALPEAASVGERVVSGAATAVPFLAAAGTIGLLAADHGGYWPTSWGWAALALAWVGGLALIVRRGRFSGLELGWVAGLVLLTGWTALSWLWTASGTQTALEVERALVYVAAAVAVAALTKPASYRALLWGAWVGSTLPCVYGLATRLFPERLGVTDALAGNRLSSPVGYWNGLGLLAAIALTLAAGLSVDGLAVGRAAAAASMPFLAPTLYFTFSRGAWIALAAALVAAVALTPRRLGELAGLLAGGLPVALAVWLAYRAGPLRLTGVPVARAGHAGHTLAWQLALVAVAAAGLALVYGAVAGTLHVPAPVRRGFAAAVAAALVAGVAAVVVHYGGPGGVVSHARHSFDRPGPAAGTDLSKRLFSLSSTGRVDEWRVALDEWRAHPVLGSGAGTYAEHWAAAEGSRGQVLNAHNLYLETLGELGPIGLALLAGTLATPLAAAVCARRHRLVPIAAGAYVAWLVHVAYDWDWQLPGVTAAAFVSAGALLVAARRDSAHIRSRALRPVSLALVFAVGALALFGLLGNRALARTGDGIRDHNLSAALSAARSARRWAPWSSQPYVALAAVRRAQGDRAGERAAYRQAVAKDPRDWELWLQLLSLGRGAERAHALERLAVLNPSVAAAVRGR